MNREKKYSLDLKNEHDYEVILAVCEALSSPARLDIIKHLQNPPYIKTVPELVSELDIPKTTLVHHLQKLENAGIIATRYKSYSHGTVRLVTRNVQGIDVNVYWNNQTDTHKTATFEQSLGVGQYADFSGAPYEIQFATSDAQFRLEENYFSSERYAAQLLYSRGGIITYYFNNFIAKRYQISDVSFSLEICSEAPFFNNDFLSDVTFFINGKEVATYVSEGDYGDRRGFLNPAWWPDVNTQYGKLVTLSVNDKGVSVNGALVNEKIRLKDLKLQDGNKTILSFGNKDTAEHVGGFNLFGAGFGDYPQDICMFIKYDLD